LARGPHEKRAAYKETKRILFALVNLWRTLSNLTFDINGAGQNGCRASANFWAVSQAVSMRRRNISDGNLSLMDYCTAGPQYAGGGYIADAHLPFVITAGHTIPLTDCFMPSRGNPCRSSTTKWPTACTCCSPRACTQRAKARNRSATLTITLLPA